MAINNLGNHFKNEILFLIILLILSTYLTNCSGGQIDSDKTAQTTYYLDFDADGYGDPNNPMESETQPEGYVGNDLDCDDNNAFANPSVVEDVSSDFSVSISSLSFDPFHDVDNDCDGDVDEDESDDHDDFNGNDDDDGDGDDNDNDNGDDHHNDDGSVDENCDESDKIAFYVDNDGDGYGDQYSFTKFCSQPEGYVENNEDCDDSTAWAHPDMKFDFSEVQNLSASAFEGIDNDCDGEIDEDGIYCKKEDRKIYFADQDGDGFGDANSFILACSQPEGYVFNKKDCDDTNQKAHPNKKNDWKKIIEEDGTITTENLLNVDNDCDGQVDEDGKKDNSLSDGSDGDNHDGNDKKDNNKNQESETYDAFVIWHGIKNMMFSDYANREISAVKSYIYNESSTEANSPDQVSVEFKLHTEFDKATDKHSFDYNVQYSVVAYNTKYLDHQIVSKTAQNCEGVCKGTVENGKAIEIPNQSVFTKFDGKGIFLRGVKMHYENTSRKTKPNALYTKTWFCDDGNKNYICWQTKMRGGSETPKYTVQIRALVLAFDTDKVFWGTQKASDYKYTNGYTYGIKAGSLPYVFEYLETGFALEPYYRNYVTGLRNFGFDQDYKREANQIFNYAYTGDTSGTKLSPVMKGAIDRITGAVGPNASASSFLTCQDETVCQAIKRGEIEGVCNVGGNACTREISCDANNSECID